ncbi:MAG: hypothetical protein NTY38_04815 [Acidobacteria bacterium]|nr:hypothetical protein [Acidobacteriota bacterium]
MSTQLTIVTVLTLVSALGVVWSVQLLRRARDWPMRILTALLGLMPIYQTICAAIETGYVQFPPAARWRMVSDLTINVLFLLSVFLLEFAIEEGHKTKVQLRVMEAAVPAGSHAAMPMAVLHRGPSAGAPEARPPDEDA